MIPIVTPEEMGAIDREAPAPVEVLVERAGNALARHALALLGGAYGRRVVVVAGKGNNGADGRAAAVRLRRRGVRVDVVDAAAAPARLPACDLVVDAAYGTGFRGSYRSPDPAGAPVLACDIPSGVDGLTGAAGDGAVAATATLTFAALKPGLLLLPGRERAGEVAVADIGLDCSRARAHLVAAHDVARWMPPRPLDAHKWKSAVWVIGGSPGMTGAPALAVAGAQRVGAGYVRRSTPGDLGDGPLESVGVRIGERGWSAQVLEQADRVHAIVVGPGLPDDADTAAEVRALVAGAPCPVLIDGTGLHALGRAWRVPERKVVVLTPHDGEHRGLTGAMPGPDRLEAARALAARTGAHVVLKGATTVVAAPDGAVLVSTSGGPQLATAGTGDVLSGLIGGLVAQGVPPLRAGAAGAWLHGEASTLGPARGLVAGDLPPRLPALLERLEHLHDGPQRTRP